MFKDQKINNGELPLVSIIMNCYNSARYLREAIDSVIAQTYSNWELVFWDNCSTDESASIVKDYDDSRIRYIYAPEHTRLGKARNLAAEYVTGEWFCFLDCDDMWMRDKLEKQVSIVKDNAEVNLVYGVMYTLQQNENTPRFKFSDISVTNPLFTECTFHPEGMILPLLLSSNFICISSVMVRTKVFKVVGGINPDYIQAEDFDLLTKIAKNSPVLLAGEVVYRIHPFNLSNSQEYARHIECINICKEFLPAKYAQKALEIYYTDLAVYEMNNKSFIKGVKTLLANGSVVRLSYLVLLRLKNAFTRRFI